MELNGESILYPLSSIIYHLSLAISALSALTSALSFAIIFGASVIAASS